MAGKLLDYFNVCFDVDTWWSKLILCSLELAEADGTRWSPATALLWRKQGRMLPVCDVVKCRLKSSLQLMCSCGCEWLTRNETFIHLWLWLSVCDTGNSQRARQGRSSAFFILLHPDISPFGIVIMIFPLFSSLSLLFSLFFLTRSHFGVLGVRVNTEAGARDQYHWLLYTEDLECVDATSFLLAFENWVYLFWEINKKDQKVAA